MTTDWENIREGWCREHNITVTEEQVLKNAYEQFGSIRRAADRLGIAHQALKPRLKFHNIKIQPPGGIRKSIIDDYSIEDGMKASKIAEEVGCVIPTVYAYAKRHNCIKIKNGIIQKKQEEKVNATAN